MHCKKWFLRILSLVLCILMLSAVSFSGNCVTYETSSNYPNSIYYDRLTDTSLTGNPRVDIINVALTQYGYSESNHWWDLSGMSEGIGNYTEYGNWYGVQSMWCAMFVSWCAEHADIPRSVIPSHAYTPTGVQWFMNRNQSHDRDEVLTGDYIPRSGDIIYFRSDRNGNIVNHVGIVLGYFDEYVYTVEGNINFDPYCTDGGQVLLRSRHISDPYIRYFCSPNYSSDVAHEIESFFPPAHQRPEAEDAQITLGAEDEEFIETPDTSTNSGSTQFNFIP